MKEKITLLRSPLDFSMIFPFAFAESIQRNIEQQTSRGSIKITRPHVDQIHQSVQRDHWNYAKCRNFKETSVTVAQSNVTEHTYVVSLPWQHCMRLERAIARLAVSKITATFFSFPFFFLSLSGKFEVTRRFYVLDVTNHQLPLPPEPSPLSFYWK